MDSKHGWIDCTSVTKITVNNEKHEPRYIIALWGESIKKVTLVYKNEYWRGTLLPAQLKTYCENLEIPYEVYMAKVRNALSDKSEYVFDFKDSILRWKLADSTTKLFVIHGNVTLEEHSSTGGTEMLIDTLFKMNSATKTKLQQLESEMVEFHRQLDDTNNKFMEFSQSKQNMEEDIYFKFLQILNAKKERISDLEEFFNMDKDGIRSTEQKIQELDSTQEIKKNINAISDSDSN